MIRTEWKTVRLCTGVDNYVYYVNGIMACRVYPINGQSNYGVKSHLPSLSAPGAYESVDFAKHAAEKKVLSWVRKISKVT